MTRFLDDGRVCLSNNAAERALRGIAIGRHNWTFAGSDRGGERAAAIYTLIETCKLCDVDPRALARESPQPAAELPRQPHRRSSALELAESTPAAKAA
jgi:transposase